MTTIKDLKSFLNNYDENYDIDLYIDGEHYLIIVEDGSDEYSVPMFCLECGAIVDFHGDEE